MEINQRLGIIPSVLPDNYSEVIYIFRKGPDHFKLSLIVNYACNKVLCELNTLFKVCIHTPE